MANFITDPYTLVSKTDARASAAGSDPTKRVAASDWNSILVALQDLRTDAITARLATPNSRTITAGIGLSGGGDLSANRTLTLANTAVAAGVYGGGSLTVDAQGRLTNAKQNHYHSVVDYGAVGDGVTDDRAAFISTLAAAKTSGARMYLPPGTYKLSKYIDFSGIKGLHVFGSGAKILYQSADVSLVGDGTAAAAENARSAFLVRYCSDMIFDGIIFQGNAVDTDITNNNLGNGIYATHCVGIEVRGCVNYFGSSLYVQDALTATNGTGDQLAVSGSTVTLTDSAGSFKDGHQHRFITIEGCTNQANNGKFPMLGYGSSTSVTFTNVDAINETSAFSWSIDDNDRRTSVIGGHSYGCRQSMRGGNDMLIDGHTFELPNTRDELGLGDEISIVGTTCTLKDEASNITKKHIGRYIKIAGATSGGNNGLFLITGVTAQLTSGTRVAALITYENASGVSELFTGSWWIQNGEKTGIGAGATALHRTTMVFTADNTTETFTSTAHGMATGYGPITVSNSGGALPTGLSAVTNYWVINITADTFKLATSLANALALTNLSISTDGTGTQTLTTNSIVLTSAASAFTANDVGKNVRIINPTSAANAGQFTITAYVSATQVVFENSVGVSETFAQGWSIDSYDRVGGSGAGFGSSHAIYVFAGRSGYKITNCTFRNIRTTAVKCSGSALPIIDLEVSHCTFVNCGAAVVWGADDSQQHSALSFHHNRVIDCGTGRDGWNDGAAIGIIGSRTVDVSHNKFWYTINHYASAYGGGLGASAAISASRYVSGVSQPIESILIKGNEFAGDPSATDLSDILTSVIALNQIGIRTHYRTGGTLTKHGLTFTAANATEIFTSATHGFETGSGPVRVSNSGGALPTGLSAGVDYWVIKLSTTTFQLATSFANAVALTNLTISDDGTGTQTLTTNIMTLTDSSAGFSQQMVGRTIEFVNSANGNDVTGAIIRSSPTAATLTYFNTAGSSISSAAGTYRIFPGKTATFSNTAHAGGVCRVNGNTFDNVCATSVTCTSCVGPDVYDNTYAFGSLKFAGDVNPRVYNNREIASNSSGASIRFDSGTSWPTCFNNIVTNTEALATTISARDMGIGVDSSTVRDYPLLGVRGKLRPTNSYEEVVVAYGSLHVDGDVLLVGGATYTYKASAPGANQFNSVATLLALINTAGTGFTAEDYGTSFTSGAVTTTHIRIRKSAQTVDDTAGALKIRSQVLNPTALVLLRNQHTTSGFCYGRGGGSAGPVANKSVIWSPHAALTSTAVLVPENEAARAIMTGGMAQGRIVCTTKALFTAGFTDNVVIGDGHSNPVTYYFDTIGAGGGTGVKVDISGATTAKDCAVILRTAILANQPGFTITSNYVDAVISAVDTSAETLTSVAHGLLTGDQVRVSNSGGGLPGGLAAATDYWVIRVDADKIGLATTNANALTGTKINLTSAGTGTNTINHGAFNITHNWVGSGGNVTITEGVTDASFQVYGLSNGGNGSYMRVNNSLDAGACCVMQHAKNSDFGGNDTGAEFRWSLK